MAPPHRLPTERATLPAKNDRLLASRGCGGERHHGSGQSHLHRFTSLVVTTRHLHEVMLARHVKQKEHRLWESRLPVKMFPRVREVTTPTGPKHTGLDPTRTASGPSWKRMSEAVKKPELTETSPGGAQRSLLAPSSNLHGPASVSVADQYQEIHSNWTSKLLVSLLIKIQ